MNVQILTAVTKTALGKALVLSSFASAALLLVALGGPVRARARTLPLPGEPAKEQRQKPRKQRQKREPNENPESRENERNELTQETADATPRTQPPRKPKPAAPRNCRDRNAQRQQETPITANAHEPITTNHELPTTG